MPQSETPPETPPPDPQRTRRGAVDDGLLQRVLRPYRDNSRYVLEARYAHPAAVPAAPQPDAPESWIVVEGACRIPGSCYIDDTGHFNAVELNITYNQLLYTGLAVTAQRGLLTALPWDLEDFFRHQLPDVLIVEYDARFRRPLDPRAFSARFEIRQALPKPHKRMLLLRTACAANCGQGGRATAEVLIALLGVPAPTAP